MQWMEILALPLSNCLANVSKSNIPSRPTKISSRKDVWKRENPSKPSTVLRDSAKSSATDCGESKSILPIWRWMKPSMWTFAFRQDRFIHWNCPSSPSRLQQHSPAPPVSTLPDGWWKQPRNCAPMQSPSFSL